MDRVVRRHGGRRRCDSDSRDSVVERKFGHMVTYQPPDMLDVPILDAIKVATVCPNCSAVQAARALGICFGDDQHEPPFKYVRSANKSAAGGNGAKSPGKPKSGKSVQT